MRKTWILILVLICTVLAFCTGFRELTIERIEQVNILSFQKDGVEAEIFTRIKNPNHLSFTIYQTDLDVTLNGISAGKACLTNDIEIKRNSSEIYNFKVKSDFSNLNIMDLPKILSMAFSKNLTVGIKGNLKVGKAFIKKDVLVDFSQEVPIGSN